MKERPILFSAPMVRALLDSGKTQTRRVCKPAEAQGLTYVVDCGNGTWGNEEGDMPVFRSPYGQPGDRLWVRESFMPAPLEAAPGLSQTPWSIAYAAGGIVEYFAPSTYNPVLYNYERWSPSIHMPRWASRILLEVTDVRVERLQDISRADARAEGAPPSHPTIDAVSREFGYSDFSRSWYAQLWDQINGAGAWDANPWVWVVSFKRLSPGEHGRAA